MKHKTGTKALSWLLSLALMQSLVPVTDVATYASNEGAYNDYLVTTEGNKEKSGDALTALQVTFNGKPWYVIEDDSTAVNAGSVTLLAADGSFGKSKFSDDNSTNYSKSIIKASFDAMTASGGSFVDVADAIVTNNDAGGKLYLLSESEVKALPNNVKEISFDNSHRWWTRTIYGDYVMTCSSSNGDTIYVNAGPNYESGVRPALKLDLSSVTFSTESKTFTLNSPNIVPYSTEENGSVTLVNMTKEQLEEFTDENNTLTFDLSGVSGSNSITIPPELATTIKSQPSTSKLAIWMQEETPNNINAWYGFDLPTGLLDNGINLQVNGITDLANSGSLTQKQRQSAAEITGKVAKNVVVSLSGSHTSAEVDPLDFGSQRINFYIGLPESWSGSNLQNAASYYLNDEGAFEEVPLGFESKTTISGTKNYAKMTLSHFSIYMLVLKSEQNAPAAPTMANNTVSSVTLNAIENGEYKCGDGEWQDSPTFTGLAMNTEYTFYQRLKADVEYAASPSSAGAAISTAEHVHAWSYAANETTITATCANTDGGHTGSTTATLTIVAPSLITFGQTGDGISAAASLTGLDAFNSATGKTIATTDIKYVGRDSTSYEESATAPTNAGKYTAKITVEGTTASVSYEIAKAPAGTPVVTMTDYTYGGEVPSPAIGSYSGESTVAYYYNSTNSMTGGTEWTNITSTTLAAGTYYMYAVIAETGNYNAYTTATTGFTVAAPYRLYVGGTQVTSSNAADVFGDGKVSYNAESNTLTLKGYSNGGSYYIEKEAGVYEADYRIAAGVYYAGTEKLTVALVGSNTLTMPEFSTDKLDNAAFFSKGDVEFTGTGSLNATGGNASDISEDSNVGSYGLCAIGENAAFTGSGAVTFTAGSGESSYGAYFGKETAVAFSGGTVTMTGGTSTGGSYGMYCGRVEVTGGEVQVTGGEAEIFSFGIYCWRDISVTGGTLTATGGSAANSSYGIRGIRETWCDIVVSGGTLNAVGGSAAKESCGIYSDWGGVDVSGGGTVTAEGGAVTGEGGRSCGISNSMHSISVKNGTLTATGGSVTGSGGKSIGLYSSVGPIYFEEGASVSCLGGTVTGENGESFGISGFGSYIMGGVITATGGNAAYSCGYYDRMALLVDAGTFTATGGEGSRSHGIFNRDYIEVNGGAVTAVGDSGSEEGCGVYLAARKYNDRIIGGGPLTISGGVVNVIGGSYGVFCDQNFEGKMIVITGGTATAAGNTAISRAPILGADVTASGSTSTDGSSPAEYSEASNDTYKWFKTETAAGEKTPITEVAFTVEEPVAGAEPTETVQVAAVPEGALSITEYEAVWLEADDSLNFVPMTSKLFEAGKHYTVEAPNEKNAGAPLIALTKPGYVLPIEYEKEPVYTLNGEETFMVTPYFDSFGPLEEVEYGVSVSPAELRFSAYRGYSEEDSALYREITASNTGNGKVKFILAGFTESSMYEQFGLIVGGMTATVYPKEGLTQGTYTATVGIEDFYNRFDTIEVPVTFTVYTRSTAPRTPAVETVTVPVSGDDETVNVTVKVSGDTATITSADVDKVMKAEDVGTVTIDVSSLKQNVTEVSIPGAMVKKIADAVADESNNADGLEIKLPTGTVTFDAEAVAAIAEQANGKDLRLNLEDVGENRLNAAQKTAVDDMDVQEVLDAYMTVNGQRISDFKGGKAAVTVSYTLKDGQTGRGVVVWYVADDGDKSEVPTAYSSKEVTFTVEHFSNYVIAYDAARAAACPQDATCPVSKFTDADAKAWYHDGVHWALDNGVMEGVSPKYFSPNGNTTRAMVATMLWRLEGSPAYVGANEFVDVDSEQWYGQAVRWANAEGVVEGYRDANGKGKIFNPDGAVTREQLVTILYRYAQYKRADVSVGEDTNILSYDDAQSVSAWATSAMQWAVGSGIVNGIDGNLVPAGNATRAQVATMLMRYSTAN